MNTDRINARVAGISFLAAMAASLAGGSILEPLLAAPEVFGARDRVMAVVGIALEFANAIAVIVIAAALYPVLRRRNEGPAIAYVAFRVLEFLSCVLAAFMPVVFLAMGGSGPAGSAVPESAVPILLALRAQSSSVLVLLFFCLGASILYWLLLRTRIVPVSIAVWGLAAVVLVVAGNLLHFGFALSMAFALPIIANEIFLGIWLIARGFSAD